ncbi:hypothetical protein [Burkholderia pseudomallei]|uniref:hypothetical protein n=1 Tax=Burkholderia pseudomallei TaxID=28450 RepID=UPI00192A0C3D|nr:hypothetical protein [Burkholderia pseudomallei]
MSTSLTTKNVDKRCGDPVGGGAESGERRPTERAPCRDAGHGSASAAVYPTYSTKACRINGLSAAHPGCPQACQQKLGKTIVISERGRRGATRAARSVDVNRSARSAPCGACDTHAGGD